MDPRDKQRPAKTDETEAPTIEQQDWDALEAAESCPTALR